MANEIEDIFNELTTIQAAITPPTGEKDIAIATDELPVDLTTFPIFLNVEVATALEYGIGLRIQRHEIDMNLVFSPADKKYSMRSRRKWVKATLNAFAAKVTLNGQVTQAQITEIVFDTPLQWNETPFMAATFRLQAEFKEAVSFAA